MHSECASKSSKKRRGLTFKRLKSIPPLVYKKILPKSIHLYHLLEKKMTASRYLNFEMLLLFLVPH